MIAANVVVYSIQDATTQGRIVTGVIIFVIIAVVVFVLRRNTK
jgi:hypothetical protein